MGRHGRRDDDRVDRIVLEDGIGALGDPRRRMPPSRERLPLGAGVRDPRQLDPLHFGEVAREVGAPVAETDET